MKSTSTQLFLLAMASPALCAECGDYPKMQPACTTGCDVGTISVEMNQITEPKEADAKCQACEGKPAYVGAPGNTPVSDHIATSAASAGFVTTDPSNICTMAGYTFDVGVPQSTGCAEGYFRQFYY